MKCAWTRVNNGAFYKHGNQGIVYKKKFVGSRHYHCTIKMPSFASQQSQSTQWVTEFGCYVGSFIRRNVWADERWGIYYSWNLFLCKSVYFRIFLLRDQFFSATEICQLCGKLSVLYIDVSRSASTALVVYCLLYFHLKSVLFSVLKQPTNYRYLYWNIGNTIVIHFWKGVYVTLVCINVSTVT